MSDDCDTCADLSAEMPDGSTCEVGADGDLTPVVDKLLAYIASCMRVAGGDLIGAEVVGDVLCLDVDKPALGECFVGADGEPLPVDDDGNIVIEGIPQRESFTATDTLPGNAEPVTVCRSDGTTSVHGPNSTLPPDMVGWVFVDEVTGRSHWSPPKLATCKANLADYYTGDFRAALDAALAVSTHVIIPALPNDAPYVLAGGQWVGPVDAVLEGCEWPTIQIPDGTRFNLADGTEVTRILFDGADNTGPSVQIFGMDVNIHNNRFTGGHWGINAGGAPASDPTRARIHNNHFFDIGDAANSNNNGGDHAVNLNWHVDGSSITDNIFERIGGNAVWAGNGADRVLISGNLIEDCGRIGIEVTNPGTPDTTDPYEGPAEGVVISDNRVFRTALFGISATHCPGAAVTGNTCADNALATPGGASLEAIGDLQKVTGNTIIRGRVMGIQCGQSSYQSVTGNIIDARGFGVQIFGGHGGLYADNQIFNPGAQGATVDGRGIMVLGHDDGKISDNHIIFENTVGGPNGPLFSPGLGIFVNGASTRMVVTGNITRDKVGTIVSLDGVGGGGAGIAVNSNNFKVI